MIEVKIGIINERGDWEKEGRRIEMKVWSKRNKEIIKDWRVGFGENC